VVISAQSLTMITSLPMQIFTSSPPQMFELLRE
jgi:hypothetical protein